MNGPGLGTCRLGRQAANRVVRLLWILCDCGAVSLCESGGRLMVRLYTCRRSTSPYTSLCPGHVELHRNTAPRHRLHSRPSMPVGVEGWFARLWTACLFFTVYLLLTMLSQTSRANSSLARLCFVTAMLTWMGLGGQMGVTAMLGLLPKLVTSVWISFNIKANRVLEFL